MTFEDAKDDVFKRHGPALEKLSTESIRVYGLSPEQILRLRDFYINKTGDTTLKDLDRPSTGLFKIGPTDHLPDDE